MIYTDSNQKHDLRDYQKTKDNNIKMNKKQLIKEIDEWIFSECPTKTAKPFFWRWTKKGEEQLVEYIIELLKAQRKEIIEMIEKKREELADLEHKQWSHWTSYMLKNLTPENQERWMKQIETDYKHLTEKEKDSDREWADRAIKIIKSLK